VAVLVNSFTDRVSGEGSAIGRVRPFLLNQLTFDLDFCVCMGDDHNRWGGGIESQDHTGQDRLITISKEGNAIGLTSSAVCFSRLETATQFCICHKVTSRIRQLSRAAPHGTVLVAFNKLRTAPAGRGMLSLRTQRSIVS